MTSTWPLDEFQIAHAAQDVIREHGDKALTNADDRIKKLNSDGFESVANTWELIREVIKDNQESDNKIRGYPLINSHPVGAERLNREDDYFEPLGEVEQALLDTLRKMEEPQGCHWLDDAGKFCIKSRAKLPSRHPYCEEHLRRSLTESGWRRLLAIAGRDAEKPGQKVKGKKVSR